MNFTALGSNVPMKKVLVFLLSGKAGVGKTFSAEYLLEQLYAVGFSRIKYIPFAKAVKEVAKYIGWDGKKDQRGRKFLQSIGNYGREYDQDCWARKISAVINNYDALPYEIVLIDDWRYENEYNHLNSFIEFEVVPINIVADERETLRGTTAYDDISEHGLDNFGKFKYVLHNPLADSDSIKTELERVACLEIINNRR